MKVLFDCPHGRTCGSDFKGRLQAGNNREDSGGRHWKIDRAQVEKGMPECQHFIFVAVCYGADRSYIKIALDELNAHG